MSSRIMATPLEFAVIAHLERWELIFRYFRAVTEHQERKLDDRTVADLFGYIPPRALFRIEIKSTQGHVTRGAYVETFIPPNELDARFIRRNLDKVKRAAECVRATEARVASLGGFSSILIEGQIGRLVDNGGCAYTTGNTLTVALIARGVEEACRRHNRRLDRGRLLVIGSTGDIGAGVVQYFKGKVRELLLCARDQARLRRQEQDLQSQGIPCRRMADIDALPIADVVVAVASVAAPTFPVNACKPDVIICDAGYPKNIALNAESGARAVFFGGMGLYSAGYESDPPFLPELFGFPDRRIAHGCMIEATVLALARRYESFSYGRGNITVDKIDEIWSLANSHGIELAPLFNHDGLWDPSPAATLALTGRPEESALAQGTP